MNKLLNPNSRVIAFLETCFDLALLNCLFLTFSLPLLSIGASLTALYRCDGRPTRSSHSTLLSLF